MGRIILLKTLLELSFYDKFHKKNRWIELLNRGAKEELKQNLYVLVQNAYGPIGGHVRVGNPDQVLDPVLTYWEAVDDDTDPDADAVIFGKKNRNGIKISGFGHDGTQNSKHDLIKKQVAILHKPGYWLEASGRPAEILYGKGVPYVKNPKVIEKLFNMPVKWLNDKGKYERKIDDITGRRSDIETVFGRPAV